VLWLLSLHTSILQTSDSYFLPLYFNLTPNMHHTLCRCLRSGSSASSFGLGPSCKLNTLCSVYRPPHLGADLPLYKYTGAGHYVAHSNRAGIPSLQARGSVLLGVVLTLGPAISLYLGLTLHQGPARLLSCQLLLPSISSIMSVT
jgi:hypothetical protein